MARNTNYKKVTVYKTTNETAARTLASWLSKQSKLIKCTVRKQQRVSGLLYCVNMRYKITVKVSSFINIGYTLCAVTNGYVMNIEKSNRPTIDQLEEFLLNYDSRTIEQPEQEIFI